MRRKVLDGILLIFLVILFAHGISTGNWELLSSSLIGIGGQMRLIAETMP